MTALQKIIKYGAIAFGTYLSIVIIGCIIFVITTIFGITMGIEYLQEGSETQEMATQSIIQEYDNIENLKIDFNICKLTIQQGQKLKVEAFNVPKKMQCKVEGTTLEIKDKSINMSWFNQNNILPEVIITIPNNTFLQKVDIKTGINDTEINYLNCENLEIKTGIGKNKFQNIITQKMEIKGGAGKTVLDKIETNYLDLDAGIGKMIFTGKISENADINSGVGRLEMNLQGNKEDYQIKTKTGLGNFVIDNESVKDNKTIGNGNKKIKINAGVGETAIYFISDEI